MSQDRPAQAAPPGATAGDRGAPAGGFALLARRLSTWTSNTLVSLIILLVGVVVGRQVLQWWHAAPLDSSVKPVVAAADDGLGDLARAHTLWVGKQPWAIRRAEVSGEAAVAEEALRASCRDVLREGLRPAAAATPAEAVLVARLARQSSLEEEPGRWRLYRIAGKMPIYVGTLLVPGAESGAEGSSPVAALTPRMVTWGMGVPMADRDWTLYTFLPAATSSATGLVAGDIPLPPGGQRSIALQVAGGGAMITFKGALQPDTWSSYYEHWFYKRGWTLRGDWQHRGTLWKAVFEPSPEQRGSPVELQVTGDGQPGSVGLLVVTPCTHVPGR